jgi:uncharacterized protein YggU (UPF0235/DUF167 family)
MYVHVSVKAGAKKESFEEVSENRFKVSVKEEAKANAANRRVIELVALHCNVSPARVRIINGHHSPSKLISITE